MTYVAEIDIDGVAVRAAWNELSGVGSRQVADRGEVTSRLYAAWLDRTVEVTIGRAYQVVVEGQALVGYAVVQKGRSVRFMVRNGEFYPGLVLERLGALEMPSPRPTTGGDGWFLGSWGFNRHVTTDFVVFDEVPSLYELGYEALCLAGREVVLGGDDEALYYSEDGQAWSALPVTGCGEIRALAWDGLKVWMAAEGGAYSVEWQSKAIAQEYVGDYRGFFNHAASREPYLVEAVSGGGYDVRSAETGGVFFHTDQAVDWWRGTLLWYPRFYYMDTERRLWRWTGGVEEQVAEVAQRYEDGAPWLVMMRDIGLVFAEGQLYTFGGDDLVAAFDFGGVLQVTPNLQGPVVQRLEDGVLFRVRRLGSG